MIQSVVVLYWDLSPKYYLKIEQGGYPMGINSTNLIKKNYYTDNNISIIIKMTFIPETSNKFTKDNQ